MVLTPIQLEEQVAPKAKRMIARLEKEVDAALVRGFDGERAYLTLPKQQIDDMVIGRVVNDYRRAGWDVQLENVPEKGVYLLFKKAHIVTGFGVN